MSSSYVTFECMDCLLLAVVIVVYVCVCVCMCVCLPCVDTGRVGRVSRL